MKTPQLENKFCRNCHHPLEDEAKYCSICSQKNTTGKTSVADLFYEVFTSIFNYDSKLFVSLRKLFSPGELTIEYFKGRHKRYLHPVRLFFTMMIIHFAVFQFIANDNIKLGMNGDQLSSSKTEISNSELVQELLQKREKITAQYPSDETKIALDSLLNSVEQKYNRFDDTISINNISIVQKDLLLLNADQLIEKYKIEDYWKQIAFRQGLKIIKDGEGFGKFLLGKLSWLILFMMPLLGLILKLLYFRSSHYYVEHLVFSFHYNAFVFFILTLSYFAATLSFINDSILLLILPFLYLYLYVAMLRVYKQSKEKTFLKFILLNFSYMIVSAFSLIVGIIIGLVLF